MTEYLAGGDLLEAITNKESYSEADAAVICRNIALTLDMLHSKGIVHRFLRVIYL